MGGRNKRKRQEESAAASPPHALACWLDCQSLTHIPVPVASGGGDESRLKILETKVSSNVQKEIFLDRFRKEVIERFDFSLKSKSKSEKSLSGDAKSSDAKTAREIVKNRVLVGFSVCSKALHRRNHQEDADATRSLDLLVMCSDFEPTRFAVHFPIAAHQYNIPLLLLPAASQEMGALLGVRCAGVVAITSATKIDHPSERKVHEAIDSFVSFVKTKII